MHHERPDRDVAVRRSRQQRVVGVLDFLAAAPDVQMPARSDVGEQRLDRGHGARPAPFTVAAHFVASPFTKAANSGALA